MFDEQKLISLAQSTTRTMTGWINLDHTILKTDDYGHVDGLRQYEPFSTLLAAADIAQSRADRIYRGCEELIAEGEHPEWHTYEMYGYPFQEAAEEVRRFCVVYAYHLGYVRFFYDARTRKLTFEGEEPAIIRYKPAALRVAKELVGTYHPDLVESKMVQVRRDLRDMKHTLEKMNIQYILDGIFEGR